MDLKTLLGLLPGPYWNDGITWSILELDDTLIFKGKWEDAIKLEDKTLNREVYGYHDIKDNNGGITEKLIWLR